MKPVQWFNAITLATAAALAVPLAVVCLMYAVHLDASPRMRHEWPTVRDVTAVLAALALLAGAAFLAQRRAWRGRHALQALLVAAVPLAGWILYELLI